MKRIWLLFAIMLLVGCTGTQQPGTPGGTGISAGSVAYIQGGNLWVKPLDGAARRLTDAGGFSSPSFSHSGDWILVRRNAELWTVRTDGSARRQLPVAGQSVFAAWSPADDRIAYRVDDRIGLMAAGGGASVDEAGGAGDKTLVKLAPGSHVTRIAWSPDGKWLGYDLNPGGPSGNTGAASLLKVPVDGGTPQEVYVNEMESPQCLIMAGWMPDGQSLLFWPQPLCSGSLLADGTILMTVPAAGGTPRELVGAMLTHQDFLAVSRDGAIAAAAGGGRITWASKVMKVVPAGGREAVRITPADVAAISPAWSPDGRRLAYSAMPDAGTSLDGGEQARAALAGRRIWVANAGGTGARALTSDEGFRDEAPRFASDGRILFARLTPANTASLWLVPADGGKPTHLADIDSPGEWFGFYGWIDWSEKLTFHTGR